jgi:RNA polymerase sigma-70 factor (ECF subfamily)
VINEALACLRRRKPTADINAIAQKRALSAEIIPFPNASPELDPETAFAQREIRMLLERAMDKLPEVFRGVVVARLVEGMSVSSKRRKYST